MDSMNRLPELLMWLARVREGLRQVGQGLAMPTTGS
jgi:hypothetical protein